MECVRKNDKLISLTPPVPPALASLVLDLLQSCTSPAPEEDCTVATTSCSLNKCQLQEVPVPVASPVSGIASSWSTTSCRPWEDCLPPAVSSSRPSVASLLCQGSIKRLPALTDQDTHSSYICSTATGPGVRVYRAKKSDVEPRPKPGLNLEFSLSRSRVQLGNASSS